MRCLRSPKALVAKGFAIDDNFLRPHTSFASSRRRRRQDLAAVHRRVARPYPVGQGLPGAVPRGAAASLIVDPSDTSSQDSRDEPYGPRMVRRNRIPELKDASQRQEYMGMIR